MKFKIFYIGILAILSTNVSNAQKFDKDEFLKDYSGDMVITTQVRGERNKAILRGTEANKNREFVLQNYTGIQPSIYPAWDGGFWPKNKPKSLDDFEIKTEFLDELVNWGVDNGFHIMHHCLIFPNKYFPQWFSKTNYSAEELDFIIEKFVTEVLTANNNKNKIDVFNVINEIFAMGKSGNYRVSGDEKEDCKWMDMGFEKDKSGLTGEAKINDEHPVFVRRVFDIAAKLTDAKLEIRDFNIAFGGKKADGLYQLIKHLKNTGVRVDAIGFQCHLNVDENGNLLLAGDNDRRFFEAAWLHKYKGKYYFSYSTGDTHFICYAIGESPYGPFTYKGRILNPVVGWTSHHSICEFKGKWYLFYHDSSLSKGVTHLRSVKIAEIKYNENGTIQTLDPYRH